MLIIRSVFEVDAAVAEPADTGRIEAREQAVAITVCGDGVEPLRDVREIVSPGALFLATAFSDLEYPIPYRNVSRPAVSLWEIRAAKAELIRGGRSQIDERTLIEGAMRRRALAEDDREKTKTARREHHRATRLAAKAPVDVPADAPMRAAQERTSPVDDLFAEPPPVFTVRPNTAVR